MQRALAYILFKVVFTSSPIIEFSSRIKDFSIHLWRYRLNGLIYVLVLKAL
jgi:hypothetical protein